MRATKIATVLQWVNDVPTSTEWYRQLLGIEPTPYDTTYFRLDEGCYLILGQASPGTGRGGTGVWFEVDDVMSAYQELKAKGISFNEPAPFDIPPGMLITLNDPDGNIIGLIDSSKGGMPR